MSQRMLDLKIDLWAMKLVPFNSFNQKDVELEKSKGWAGK